MASEKKDVIIVKKKKRKDKKDKNKKKKTTKKKPRERGITVNIKLEKAIGEAKAKAPKTARGFAPKVASIRGQRSRGGGEVNTRQAEINTNLLNNVYAIRAQATKQQEEYEKLAKEQGASIKTLSNNLGILQNQVTQLGTQVLNPPQPAPAPTPSTSQRALITMGSVGSATMGAVGSTMGAIGSATSATMGAIGSVGGAIGSATSATIGAVGSYMGRPQQPININVPPAPAPAPLALPGPPQPSEEEQQFRTDMKRGLVKLGQRQQGLYQGMQLIADAQHNIHHRLGGIEEAGRQIAGNQGTLMALESIYNEGFEESNVEQQQPPAPPPAPPAPPPPMETIPEEDPARMSSSVDPQEEEKADLLIEDVKTADESVIKQDKKMRGPVKGTARIAFTTEQLSTILDLAGDAVGKNNKGMTEFFKNRQDYKDLVKEYQGNESSIKNKITKLKKALEQQE